MVRIVLLVNRAARFLAAATVGWIIVGVVLELGAQLLDRLATWAEDPDAPCVICSRPRRIHSDDPLGAGHPFVDPDSDLAPMYVDRRPLGPRADSRGYQRSPGRPDLREGHALAGELAWSSDHPPEVDPEPIDVRLVRLKVPAGPLAAAE